jgi:tRNA threonylcarbamoyl adenosine modification protein YjeE
MGAETDAKARHFSHRIALPDLAATQRFGAQIAAGLHIGDTIALEGDLGMGKTTLARAIPHALGVVEDVPSPTFTLIQSYETPHLAVRHYDLYRLHDESEMDELGLDDALEEGAALIEWPERAAARLPEDRLTIELTMMNNVRHAFLTGPPRWRILGAPDAD